MTHHISVSVRELSKTFRIPREDAPRWKDYATRPAWAIRAPKNRDVRALEDVSFDLQEGEVLGIIGRNGAGKSTLLKILSRITTPTTGQVMMRGRVASLLEVGTGFHPELTGRENIYLNGMLLGMSAKSVSKAFDAICDFASVGAYINVPIKRYSSGMQLRLAFAVAAHLSADTMIVDEVLAVGDAEFQRKCLGAMRDVSRAGRTTLFVSHNMSAIEALCSRVIWLDKGRVLRSGSAAEVVRDYLSAGAVAPTKVIPCEIDVSDAPRGYQLGGARISSVTFCRSDDATERLPWRVAFGEAFGLEMHFSLRPGSVQPIFAIGFRNDRGEDVLTSHSSDAPITGRLAGANGTARVAVGAPWLRPGTYYVEVAIVSGMQLLDYVADAAVLVVEEDVAPGAPILALKKGAVSPVWPWQVG